MIVLTLPRLKSAGFCKSPEKYLHAWAEVLVLLE